MKEDYCQFSRLLPEDFCDVWRGFPKDRLPLHGFPLENEMKKGSQTTILIIGRRPLPDGNFNCHREFLESLAVLVMR
jgi:hypothetical protein